MMRKTKCSASNSVVTMRWQTVRWRWSAGDLQKLFLCTCMGARLHGCSFCVYVCVCAFEAFLACCSFCENLREVAVRWHLRVDGRVTTNVT